MQAAPPGLPFVRGLWRLVVNAVDSRCFESGHALLRAASSNATATAAGTALTASRCTACGVRRRRTTRSSAPSAGATTSGAASAVAPVLFTAAVTHEHQFHLLLEAGHVGDVVRTNAPSAENPD